MGQDVANVRLAPKGGNDDECETATVISLSSWGIPLADSDPLLLCSGDLIGSPWICLAIPISWSITVPYKIYFQCTF